MGVPMDRGLTRFLSFFEQHLKNFVEMGVPMDRGLTQYHEQSIPGRRDLVEMGVPMDRGLTHSVYIIVISSMSSS